MTTYAAIQNPTDWNWKFFFNKIEKNLKYSKQYKKLHDKA